MALRYLLSLSEYSSFIFICLIIAYCLDYYNTSTRFMFGNSWLVQELSLIFLIPIWCSEWRIPRSFHFRDWKVSIKYQVLTSRPMRSFIRLPVSWMVCISERLMKGRIETLGLCIDAEWALQESIWQKTHGCLYLCTSFLITWWTVSNKQFSVSLILSACSSLRSGQIKMRKEVLNKSK